MVNRKCSAKTHPCPAGDKCPERRFYQSELADAVKTADFNKYEEARKNLDAEVTHDSDSFINESLNNLPLKEMDASLLTYAILDKGAEIGIDEAELSSALKIASFLHRKAYRKNRGVMPVTHYVEHPLRNTLRIMRWGITNKNTIIASILHDTVEDCAKEMAQMRGRISSFDDEAVNRAEALAFVEEKYGSEIARIVKGVSNPLTEPGIVLTREQKRVNYFEHVSETIKSSPEEFVVKSSDFMDNAAGLHHNKEHKAMTTNMALKYAPMVPVFEEALEQNKNLFSASVYNDLKGQLRSTKDRLFTLSQG